MNQRILTLLLMAGVAAGTAEAKPQSKPNIIVVFTDDHGYADLGVHGQAKDVKTPHLDALAKSGITCTAGYITAPQCGPSRAGLLTGRYQQRFGFEDIPAGPLPLDETTLADRLKTIGYRTGMVGKWHLDPCWINKAWTARELNEPNPTAELKIPAELVRRYFPGNRGFDEFFKGEEHSYWANYTLNGNDLTSTGERIHVPGYRVDIQTDAALTFIDRNKEEPFFLYLAYFAPHVPLEATEKYLSRFPGEMPERRRYALAMISAVDDGVGRIRERLKQYELDQNTLIFFISDNGAPLKIRMEDLPISYKGGAWDGSLNTPWIGEKGMLMEGGIRVPYLVSWPAGLPAGQIYKDPVNSLDVAPTCLAIAGQPIPPELDGENLIPFLQGDSNQERTFFWRFWEQAAVRKGRWKYLYLSNGKEYLFDMESSEHEKKNLLKLHPEKAKALRASLEKWAEELSPKGLPTGPLRGEEAAWFAHYLPEDN